MMVMDDLGNGLLLRVFSQNLRPLDRVRLDDLVLFRRELPWFEEYGIRNGDLSEVVKDSADSNQIALVITQTEDPSNSLR